MSATIDWFEQYERGQIARRVMPFPAQTKSEHLFKAAALGLILEGTYPSARQIRKRLGRDVSGKVNLNGRECKWLREIRELFGIEPYIGYTKRQYRDDLQNWLQGGRTGPRYPFKLRRGPKGTLVVCDDYIDNRRAEQKALAAQLDNDRYAGSSA